MMVRAVEDPSARRIVVATQEAIVRDHIIAISSIEHQGLEGKKNRLLSPGSRHQLR
jgi:hypothetical protein